MMKFPVKPDEMIAMIKRMDDRLDIEILEKLLSIAPVDDVSHCPHEHLGNQAAKSFRWRLEQSESG